MDSKTKQCTACNAHYQIEPEDLEFYQKMNVPVPRLCPDCRFKRRAQFRNERILYSRTCDKCHKNIISVYHEESPYTVYCLECFDADDWDAFQYGARYDASRPFFEQMDELLKRVPKKALLITGGDNNVNSDYTNVAANNKNCYLLFNTAYCEDSMYSRGIKGCRDTVDAYFGIEMERCYEAVNVHKSSGVIFGHNVTNCVDSWFLLSCTDCINCFGCVNLRHKSYHWFNEELSKDDYEKRLTHVKGSYQRMNEMRKKFEAFALQFPHRENNNMKSEDCTGDYLFSSTALRDCYEITEGENCKYMFASKNIKDSYDTLGYGYGSELLLDCAATGYANRVIGSYWVENGHDCEYCFFTLSSEYCFGCDGLKKGKFCILNKQYSEEEYHAIRKTISEELTRDGEYGLFFPPHIAPFAYNETVAQDYMPLAKDEALAQGFRWQEKLPMTTGAETLAPESIPDHIMQVTSSITKDILACLDCKRNYKITPKEFAFYQKMSLPVPRQCFSCRHVDRIKRRGPMKLFDRSCAKCSKDIRTTFAPPRTEIVYCVECYQTEVI
ncbi:hypothetical protein HY732_00645 [Candidatus Uhrbacteria bacterium]|nr:hypothetical protein [Candidatus Uhrbacteria bacterium]